jgi:integrase
MANINRLREKQVQNAEPRRGLKKDLLLDGAGLYLEVSRAKDGSINRSWLFRYQFDFKRHDMGLGPLYVTGLAAAREQRQQLRQQIQAGVDPLSARQEAKRERLRAQATRAKAVTFKECAEMYLKVHSDKWRNARHRAQWAATLSSYVYPTLGDLAVADIDVAHVQRALEPIWQRIPETARRTRSRVELVMDYATAAKFRSGDNPASWSVLRHLLGGKKQVAHHPALAFAQAPNFFSELQSKGSVTSKALQFVVLTATRTGQVLGAQWDEVDLQARVWTVPAARMKSGREHRIPLSDSAVAILKALPRGHGAYVFHAPSRHGKPLHDKAMLDVVYEMRPGTSVHGFRSTFRDWAAERTAFPHEVCEMALAHVVGNKTEAAYRRGDLFEKRRQLMAAWDRFLNSPVPAEGDVVHLATVVHRGR